MLYIIISAFSSMQLKEMKLKVVLKLLSNIPSNMFLRIQVACSRDTIVTNFSKIV